MLVLTGWNKTKCCHEVNITNVEVNSDIIREIEFALDIEFPTWELTNWDSNSITLLTDIHKGFFMGKYVTRVKKVLPVRLGWFSYQFPGDRKTLYYL